MLKIQYICWLIPSMVPNLSGHYFFARKHRGMYVITADIVNYVNYRFNYISFIGMHDRRIETTI